MTHKRYKFESEAQAEHAHDFYLGIGTVLLLIGLAYGAAFLHPAHAAGSSGGGASAASGGSGSASSSNGGSMASGTSANTSGSITGSNSTATNTNSATTNTTLGANANLGTTGSVPPPSTFTAPDGTVLLGQGVGNSTPGPALTNPAVNGTTNPTANTLANNNTAATTTNTVTGTTGTNAVNGTNTVTGMLNNTATATPDTTTGSFRAADGTVLLGQGVGNFTPDNSLSSSGITTFSTTSGVGSVGTSLANNSNCDPTTDRNCITSTMSVSR